MEYPTYAEAKSLAEQPAENYTSKHRNGLTARLMDHGEPDEQTSHDKLGWCALYLFQPAEQTYESEGEPLYLGQPIGAAIVWEHDASVVMLEAFGDYAEVYAAWQSYYVTRWDEPDDTPEFDTLEERDHA